MKLPFRPVRFNEYFVFFLPVFFVIDGYVQNFGSISPGDALELIGIYVLATIVLVAALFAYIKSWRKAALFTFILFAFHFFFGAFHDAVKGIMPGSFLTKYVFILPITACFAVALLNFFKRTNRRFDRITKFLNIVLCILLFTDIVLLSRQLLQRTSAPPAQFDYLSNCDSCDRPDIYFIVADEYAGKKTLKDQFNFDNSSFESWLKQRGFHLVDSTISNYNFTAFSVASTLNMRYLTGLEGRFSNRQDMIACYRLINEAPLWRFLKHCGYTISNQSIFNIDGQPGKEDQHFLVMGKRLITNQTFLSRIDRDLRYHTIIHLKIRSEIERFYKRTLQTNNEILRSVYKQIRTKNDHPTFTYIHLTMPHYPYYFRADGSETPLESLVEDNKTNKRDYIEYLQYVNGEYRKLIDAILQHSEKPPVIILLGDHGFRHLPGSADKRYQFLNLNAVLLPGQRYQSFYPGMSNVNLFPLLWNTIFGLKIPLQKDSTSLIAE